MSKLKCVIYAPVDTYSGYGARARDLIKSIIDLKKEEWNIKIFPCNWGHTPLKFIDNNIEQWGFLKDYMINSPNLPYQPDIWMMLTVPSEFQRAGKYNIGFTAGIETTVCDPSWIEGVNKMDLTIVSSKHAKQVFENTKYQKQDQTTGQIIEQVELNKPVEILFEGINFETFNNISTTDLDLTKIKEDFCFLFVGHWLQGHIGEDRKNVGLLIKSFFETFKNKTKKPALILKISGAGSSYVDRDQILSKIIQIKESVNSQNLPNIYLLHGDLEDKDMNKLYNHPKIKAFVTIHKGEGFGRPILEFSLTKKPIICSGYSGPLDFLKPEFNCLIGGTLTPIHKSAQVPNMLVEGSTWFSPNLIEVHDAFINVYENYKEWKEKATRQAYISKTKFSLDEMKKELDIILKTHLPEFPKPVQLKLPESLKKISLPKKELKVENNG